VVRWLGVGEFNEQPCVIGGVVVCIYIVDVQGEKLRRRATIIRLEDSEVNYLLTHRAVRLTVPGRYLAKTPAMFGPFEEYVLPNHLFSCWVKWYKHVTRWWHGCWLETSWK